MSGVSEAELQPGDVVARKYTIIEAIGVGGSATVYRAQRVGMKQQVALKVMHAEHPDSDNEKARFAREAEFVMKLKHPHVVPLLDYGHTEDDVPFLVFALLHGQSLERKIKTAGALRWLETGRLSSQVLKALERAHSLGVVHRDIKPANIFLSDHGALGEIAQVLDFGLAKLVKEPDANVTQAGALLGTPRYMAPEQVRGETITHAADIYSFGLVMAEMLLGRPLVTGDKELDIYVAQGSDKPIFIPREVLSTPFGNIIQRAVDKKVEVRYHMASQMLADVASVLANLEGPSDTLDDVEADLDATRMIDPSAAPVLVNPHAEKMRRVLNAAAAKKAAEKERAERKAAAESSEKNPPATRTELPTRIPPPAPLGHEEEGIRDEPTEVTDDDADPGPPPPIPAAAFDHEPAAPVREAAPEPLHANPPPVLAPLAPLPDVAVAGPPAGVGGPARGPLSSAVAPLAEARAPQKQTGLWIALVLVIVLILAGVGAILWLLGLLPPR